VAGANGDHGLSLPFCTKEGAMAIEMTCTGCGKVLHLPDAAAGKRGKCPHCGATLQVPTVEALTKGGPLGFSYPAATISLWDAVGEGNIGEVKAHIFHKTDINVKDVDGQTPLHVAARVDRVEMATLLLANGANVNETDNYGKTPLFGAARKGSKDMVELLTAHGADINARNKDGWTPLHLVARFGQTEAVELLMGKGADINAKANDGRTALRVAIDERKSAVVELLRKAGAKEEGRTKAED
jgi:ankyrin repeat protein